MRVYPRRYTTNAGPNPAPIPEGACDTCLRPLDENEGLARADEHFPKDKIWRFCDESCEDNYDPTPWEVDV